MWQMCIFLALSISCLTLTGAFLGLKENISSSSDVGLPNNPKLRYIFSYSYMHFYTYVAI